jgi:hypothetical protein
MENFIESISNYFTDEFRSQLANSLGETQGGITKALSAIIPVSLQRLGNIGEGGAEGQNEIMRLTTDADKYYSHSPNLSKLHNDERGSDLPQRIFGNDERNVARKVAAFAGIRELSSDRLMVLALPVIAGKLGHYFLENNLSGNGLSQFFSSKKNEITNLIPTDYRSLGDTSDNTSAHKIHVPAKKKMFPTWVMYSVIILVVLLLVYLSRR